MDGLVVVLFASSAGEWNNYVMTEFGVLVIMSRKTRHEQNRKPLCNKLFSKRDKAGFFISILATIT